MVESNLTEISNEVVRTAVHDTAVKHLKTDKVKINVEAASKVGDNFIGVVYRVSSSKFELKGVSDKNKNDSKMIVKVAPQNAARRERFYSRPCFLREIYLYDEVTFEKLQSDKKPKVIENLIDYCLFRFYHFFTSSKNRWASLWKKMVFANIQSATKPSIQIQMNA